MAEKEDQLKRRERWKETAALLGLEFDEEPEDNAEATEGRAEETTPEEGDVAVLTDDAEEISIDGDEVVVVVEDYQGEENTGANEDQGGQPEGFQDWESGEGQADIPEAKAELPEVVEAEDPTDPDSNQTSEFWEDQEDAMLSFRSWKEQDVSSEPEVSKDQLTPETDTLDANPATPSEPDTEVEDDYLVVDEVDVVDWENLTDDDLTFKRPGEETSPPGTVTVIDSEGADVSAEDDLVSYRPSPDEDVGDEDDDDQDDTEDDDEVVIEAEIDDEDDEDSTDKDDEEKESRRGRRRGRRGGRRSRKSRTEGKKQSDEEDEDEDDTKTEAPDDDSVEEGDDDTRKKRGRSRSRKRKKDKEDKTKAKKEGDGDSEGSNKDSRSKKKRRRKDDDSDFVNDDSTDDELAPEHDSSQDDNDDFEDQETRDMFENWNVPSWQELISSLYRPER